MDTAWQDGVQATIIDPRICARSSMSAGCLKAGVKKGVPQRWRNGGSGSVIIDTDHGTCPGCLPGFWMSPERAGTGRSEKCLGRVDYNESPSHHEAQDPGCGVL